MIGINYHIGENIEYDENISMEWLESGCSWYLSFQFNQSFLTLDNTLKILNWLMIVMIYLRICMRMI